jgi:hypothetical protein
MDDEVVNQYVDNADASSQTPENSAPEADVGSRRTARPAFSPKSRSSKVPTIPRLTVPCIPRLTAPRRPWRDRPAERPAPTVPDDDSAA